MLDRVVDFVGLDNTVVGSLITNRVKVDRFWDINTDAGRMGKLADKRLSDSQVKRYVEQLKKRLEKYMNT